MDGPTVTPASLKLVLVCDDERHIPRLVQTNLKRQGYEVTCAEGGFQALALLEQESFDMAVVEYHMTGIDGYQLLEWIKTHERTADVTMRTKSIAESARLARLPYKADRYVR